MEALRAAVESLPVPVVTEFSNAGCDPFRILVSTVLSLRTRDATTEAASLRLFALADTPAALAALELAEIERAIFPVGFYRTKARTLRELSRTLLDRHAGTVPRDLDDLLALRGVGRKTANLVLTLGHRLPGICVDVHVHRITNRWGFLATRSPAETEFELRRRLPRRYWIPINDWLVTWGQQVCTPLSPRCSICPLARWCDRRGVTRAR